MREGAGYSSDYICQIVVWSQYMELDTNENQAVENCRRCTVVVVASGRGVRQVNVRQLRLS